MTPEEKIASLEEEILILRTGLTVITQYPRIAITLGTELADIVRRDWATERVLISRDAFKALHAADKLIRKRHWDSQPETP